MSENKKERWTKEEKERLKSILGLSDSGLDGWGEFFNDHEEEQRINREKAKILFGEEYVKKVMEKDPNAYHSFHFSEPYKSMSLEELRRLRRDRSQNKHDDTQK